MSDPFFVLSLDGGGSKGVYSLGVLREVERLVAQPLHQKFSLVYGTSTGAIITALLALGESVDRISERYFEMIPEIMGKRTRRGRSATLTEKAQDVFGDQSFDAFQTDVGIVATHYEYRRPMIFKNSIHQAYGRKATFAPGFGCRIADAVVASCSAFPYFERHTVPTDNQGEPELLDGGFVANNPTLLALADALQALEVPREQLRILSVGTGSYPEPKPVSLVGSVKKFWPFQLLETTFAANTNTIEQIRSVFFADIAAVRVDDSFADRQYATNLLESDLGKLKKIQDLGRESFGAKETEIRSLLLAE